MVILAVKGYSIHEVEVQSLPRTGGQTKYGAERYLRGAMDFLTVFFLSGYLERPLHLFGGTGIALIGGGTLLLMTTIIARLFGTAIQPGGTTLSVGALMMLTGVQLFGVGLIAEMVGNLENSARSTGKVSDVIGIERRSNRAPSAGVRVDRRQSAEDLLELGHDLEMGPMGRSMQDDDEVTTNVAADVSRAHPFRTATPRRNLPACSSTLAPNRGTIARIFGFARLMRRIKR